MPVFLICGLAFVVYLDVLLLQKKDPFLFAEVFLRRIFGQGLRALILLSVYLFILFLIGDSGTIVSRMAFSVGQWLFYSILFFYYLWRMKFGKAFEAKKNTPLDKPGALLMASEACGVVLLWFIVMVGISVFLKIANGILPVFEHELGEMVFIAALSLIVFVLLIYRVVKKYSSLSFSEVVGLSRQEKGKGFVYVVSVLLGIGCGFLSSVIMVVRPGQPVTPLGDMLESTMSVDVFLVFLGVAVFLAPFLEEIIFRGFFFHVVEKFKGQVWAIVVVAGVFSVMHYDQYWGDWSAIVMVTVLGVVLTMVRAKTGSSIPGVIMHYTYNAAVTLMPVFILMTWNPSYYIYQKEYFHLDVVMKEELLRASIQKNPGYAQAYNDLAWLFAEEEKKLPEALRLIEMGLELSPQRFAFLDTKAEVLYKTGRVEEAIAIAKELDEKYSDNEYIQKQLKKFQQALPVQE